MFNLNNVSMNFIKRIEPYRNMRIAVYGTGNNAKAILKSPSDIDVFCVVENTPSRSTFMKYPVMSIEQAIDSEINVVVLAAETDIEIIIYRRIEEICRRNNVKVLGLHLGDIDKLFSKHKLYGYEANEHVDLNQIKELIDSHDIISFDIFDTIIERKTLIPQDVFLILQNKTDTIHNFQFRRFHSEIVNDKENPSYDEIYDFFKMTYVLENDEVQILKNLEIDIENSIICAKEAVVTLFEYAKRKNKTVYLISDMYLSKESLRRILDKNGITGYADILVSNEFRSSKNEGLFEYYVERCGEDKRLHIGDHPKLDGINAIMHGIDAVILPNALDLFKKSRYQHVLMQVDTINERSIVALFANKLFSDPFERRHVISEAREYAYLFLGPLIAVFMTWLIEETRKSKYSKLLFASRDGYLLLKLYKKAIEILGIDDAPEGLYLYTSRMACLRSYCTNEEGLKEVIDQYNFTLEDVSRNFSESDAYHSLSKEEIFGSAQKELSGYKKYLKELGIDNKKELGIVDLVSGGTCQYYLEKLLLNKMTGLYLCRGLSWVKIPPYIKALTEEHPNDPAAYFSKIEQLTLLEAVITSPEPSLAGFTEMGEPVFLEDKSSDDDRKFVKEMQDGISDFFEEYIRYLYVEGHPVHISIVKELMSYRNVAEVDPSLLSHIYLEDELLGIQFGRKGDNAKKH